MTDRPFNLNAAIRQRSFDGGVSVSVLGVGCSRVGSISNRVPMREIEATLEAAVAAGVNLFDTADIYGQGDSERILGRLLARCRDQLFITTKIGFSLGHHSGVIRVAKPLLGALVRRRPRARSLVLQARARKIDQNFSPQHLSRAVDNSRRRLGVDRLDGLLLHNPPPEVLGDPAIHDFLYGLLQRGKASQVGVSVEAVSEVEAALTNPAITMVQVPVAVAIALSDTGVLQRMRRRGMGLFVREILRKSDAGRGNTRFVHEALSAAIAPEFVTAAIIGVSTRCHLRELLSVVS